MKKLPIVEIVMGTILIISIIGYYSLQQDKNNNDTLESTAVSSENNDESKQLTNANGEPYTLPVWDDKSGNNSEITNVMDYYSKKVYITEDKFLEQQYGNIGDTVYFAKNAASSLNYTPISAKVTNVEVTDKISDEYMKLVNEKVSKENKSGCRGWNCFVINHGYMDDMVTKEKAESLSSYVIADVVLTNYTDSDVIISITDLQLAVVEDNGLISWNVYSEADNSDYVSRAGDGHNIVVLEKDKDVDYDGKLVYEPGKFVPYREPDPEIAGSSCFYLDKGELKLKLLYVTTDKELQSGKLCFCAGVGTEGQSNRDSRKYHNDGIRIRINPGVSDEVNN